MSSSTSRKAYLAEKYMSGPKADAILAHAAQAKPKKKKRKADSVASPSTALGTASFIKDDDAGWGAPSAANEEEDDAMEAVVASDRTFKKRRTDGSGTSWAVVREAENEDKEKEDEQPVMVEPESAFSGGLLTSKQLKERAKKDAAKAKQAKEAAVAPPEQETVYRDAAGRRIDMKAEKEAAARKKREREEKEKERMEWGKGVVQREDADAQRRRLEEIRGKDWVRRADDVELNQTQREEERWNDPAAAFLTKKRAKGPRRPEYKGPPPPPNRFGIKPGYRWDGVDRSNGFEKKLFQKQNERRRTVQASHDWSVDDM